jgi:branched-chain amino acid transport system substrate-binding protein
MKRVVGWFGFALAALALAGLPAGAGEPIKIGVIQPLTGATAFEGNAVVNGMKMALEEWTAKGVLPGRTIELVVEDGQCVPPKSVSAAEKLIVRDKVVGLLGAFCSSSTGAVMPVAKQYKVPHITGVSTAPPLTEQGNEWFFRAQATSALMAKAFGPILVKDVGVKKAAFLVVNDDFGRAVVKEFGDAIKAAGAQVVATEIYDRKETDLTSYLTKLRSLGVDSIGTAAYASHGIAMAKQMKEVGLKATVFGEGAWTTEAFFKGADADLRPGQPRNSDNIYAIVEYVYTINNPLNNAFVKKYVERHGENPSKYASAGWLIMSIMADAIKRAGKAEPAAIRDALEKTDFTSFTGTYRFNEKHQAYNFDVYLTKNEGGKPNIFKAVKIEKP